MFETLDKMMLAGLGAISMTRDRADKISMNTSAEVSWRRKIERDSSKR